MGNIKNPQGRQTASGLDQEQTPDTKEEKKTMTAEELASSTHPLAPEHPLEAPEPPPPIEEAADDTEPAPPNEEPAQTEVVTEQPAPPPSKAKK